MSRTIIQSAPASLFDLRTVIEHTQIDSLIKAYQSSDRSEAAAEKLLAPHQVEGTVVLTDTSGLTKLSKTKHLLEVLACIQIPKELIFELGKKISGESIGVWAADNTAMFYNTSVSIETLITLQLLIQERLKHEKVQIGMGIHTGKFYRLGDGMYGEAYILTDDIAENQSSGGEILVSESTKHLLQASPDAQQKFLFTQRNFGESQNNTPPFYVIEATHTLKEHLDTIVTASRFEDIGGTYHQAIPFPIRFYRALISYLNNGKLSLFKERTKKYFLKTTVLIVQMHQTSQSRGPCQTILESFLVDDLFEKIVKKSLRPYQGKIIKIGSKMAILSFESEYSAVNGALEIRKTLQSHNILCSAGIEKGKILFFRIGRSRSDCSGMAINIASKLGQDLAMPGEILVGASVKIPKEIESTPFCHEISGATFTGNAI